MIKGALVRDIGTPERIYHMNETEVMQLAQTIRTTTHNLKVDIVKRGETFYIMLSRVLVDPRDKEPLMWFVYKPADWVKIKIEMAQSKH
jgi:hypothetical protein